MENTISILMVDDHAENLLSLEAILESSMYRLESAFSGEEALKYVLKNDFAVILLDVQMPGMNGYETARMIRMREKSRYTPIIFITAGYQDQEQILQGYALGAIDYIFKPVDPETLRYKISGFVNMYRYQEQLEIMVQQRTKDLLQANENLLKEISYRKTSDAHFKAIFEEARIGIITQTKEGFILKANPEFQKIIGYSETELSGMHWSQVTYPDDAEETQEFLDQVRSGKINHYQMEKRYIRKDGKMIWADLNLISSDDNNLIIAFIEDITDRKIMEEEMVRLDRLNLVGEMAAGISHEVRNPMTTVKGFLQLLLGKNDCEQYHEYYKLMIDEIDRANSIITEFLSIGRNTPTNLEKQNLNTILNALLPLITADGMAHDKDVKVEVSPVPDLLLNSKEIRQVILNLARNGLEAMSPGGNLTIKTYSEENYVVLAIQDEGRGIKPEVLEKMGTPFFTTKENGTGLGLGICYSIAARHNATIKIATGSNGTSVYVKFKIA